MARRVAHLAVRLGKRRPFAFPEQEAYLNIVRTHAVLSAPFDRLMKAHGISQPLYNILRILRGHLRNDRRTDNQHATRWSRASRTCPDSRAGSSRRGW